MACTHPLYALTFSRTLLGVRTKGVHLTFADGGVRIVAIIEAEEAIAVIIYHPGVIEVGLFDAAGES